MCGISGMYGPEIRSAELTERVNKANGLLHHRGPDGQGIYQDGHLALGHTRLAIVDTTHNGHQPMQDNTGDVTVVFNGEIYNFETLKTTLTRQGHVFRSHCDTEVIVYGYKEWGTALFEKLDGFFALAIYDKRQHCLVLARDRFGQKPLYYAHTTQGLVFASELPAVVALLGHQPTYSMAGLNHYLALGYILEPYTQYEGVLQLKAGSYVTVDLHNNSLHKHTYWSLADQFHRTQITEKGRDAHELLEILQSAVKKRLMGDVEVGCLLSGGIDSATIAAIAQQYQPRLRTFSAGFDHPRYDESGLAAQTAQHIGTRHETFAVPDFQGGDISDVIHNMEQLFADNSYLPMLRLSAFVANEVKVVLSGDGADEMFFGYPTSQADLLQMRLGGSAGILKPLGLGVSKLIGRQSAKAGLRYRWYQFFSKLHADHRVAHYRWRRQFDTEERVVILGEEYRELIYDTDPEKQFMQYYNDVAALPLMKQHQYVDMKTWLEHDILVKVDRTSMKYGLEIRNPFLDPEVLEYSLSLPVASMVRPGAGKIILKEAVKDLLPPSVINRKKSGFNAPVGAWLKVGEEDEFRAYTRYVFEKKIKGNDQHCNSIV